MWIGDARRRWPAAALAVVSLAAGCGGEDPQAARDGGAEPVIVSAAASLKEALTACSDGVEGAEPRMSFGGSDELAAQIRQGVEPDVYLAASTALPEALAEEGLLRTPVAFAANELVLAVPRDSRIASLRDLGGDGVTLAIGSDSVPIGIYTREVLARLGERESAAILDGVRSNEPDVRGIVGKLVQGAVDAGFVYNTDVVAAGGALKAIELPAELQPAVAYGGAVVEGAPHPGAAQRYLDSLTSGACAEALAEAGFGAPPG